MSTISKNEHRQHWTSIDSMRPTQCTVGMLEVNLKMDELRERAEHPSELKKYLESHPIPAVLGPDGRMYLTDHHHMGLALTKLADEFDESGKPAADNPYRQCAFDVVKDYSGRKVMSLPEFRAKLEEHSLCHPYDDKGQRVDPSTIPKHLSELADDPYRSLAGLARKAGAYDKVEVPFTEFKWADFFRDKIKEKLINPAHINEAIAAAVKLAHSPEASSLPGFSGTAPPVVLPTLDDIGFRLNKRHGADDAAPGLPVAPAHRAPKG